MGTVLACATAWLWVGGGSSRAVALRLPSVYAQQGLLQLCQTGARARRGMGPSQRPVAGEALLRK